MLKWTRRTVEVPFLNSTRKTTEHVTSHAGREYALRKADDIYFVYIDGAITESRAYFNTLREGKAAIERVASR